MSNVDWQNQLGLLLGGVKALETNLRLYLEHAESNDKNRPHPDYSTIKVGSVVPPSFLTQHARFEGLLASYNTKQTVAARRIENAAALIKSRNAIVHGIVFTGGNGNPGRYLVAFNTEKKASPVLSFREEMTSEWFLSQQNLFASAVYKVASAS